MKYLDTLNSGRAKHKFVCIDKAADVFSLPPSTVCDLYNKHVASPSPSNPPLLNATPVPPQTLLINNTLQSSDGQIDDLVRRVISGETTVADAFRNNDGERNGCIKLLRMFKPRTLNDTDASTTTAADDTTITDTDTTTDTTTGTTDTTTDTTDTTDTTTDTTDTTTAAATATVTAAVTASGIIQPRDPGDGWWLPFLKNLLMMKHGASC